MIGINEISEILSLYKKHGWKLRRALLSETMRSKLTEKDRHRLFGGNISTKQSQIDAVWFERSRKDGGVAWEIRLLSNSPLALCESLPKGFPADQIKHEKKNMENRLLELASKGMERT